MPNPQEIAELVVNGREYRDWDMVSVQRSFQSPASVMTFSAASPIESGGWAAQKLKIGDLCSCKMAGVTVANGVLYLRQVAFDDRRHGLQVQVASKVQDILYATVDQKPGQFKDYSIEGIGNALVKPYGLKFKIDGNPSGADKKFPRFNVQPGETVFAAISRLCRMRNLFLIDDKDGNLVAKRIDGSGGAQAHLEEGRNIKSATCVMSHENVHNMIQVLGQRPGNDQNWGDEARDTSASVSNPEIKRHRPLTIPAEEPGDQQDMQMRAEHAGAVNIATMLQAEVTVQGWHDPSGVLWIEHVGKEISVKSAMLFPEEQRSLAVQGVVLKQTNAGTETVLSLIIPSRLGGGGQIQAEPDFAKANAARPEPSDV
jgi:prophage tail gpP-like protein